MPRSVQSVSYPRVTWAFLVLGLGAYALVGCTARQEPTPPPATSPPATITAPASAAPRPGLTVRPAGGDVGAEFTLQVTGVACSGGQPLIVVWDTRGQLTRRDDITDAGATYQIGLVAPKVPYGSHEISVRCGENGPDIASTRYLLTNAPIVTVDPISALPGTPLSIDLTGFACANDFNRPTTTVITWDGAQVALPFAVPAGSKPGRHVVLARCDWPDGTAPPQAATPVWVPGIVAVTPTSGLGGTNVQVAGIGFNCAEVALDVDGSPVTRTKVRVDRERQGLFTAAVTVPIGAAPGPHEVGAACTDAGARPVAIFTVDGPTVVPSPSITPTGGTRPIVWVGLGVLGLVVLAALAIATYLARRAVRPRPRRPGLQVRVGLGEPQVQVREAEERP